MRRRAAARAGRPRRRLARTLVAVLLVAGAVVVAIAVATVMPGRSFSGVPRPLRDAEQAQALRLRAHVTALAEAIGERNRAHYDGLERARTYVAAQLTDAGYHVRFLPFRHGGDVFYNVEATLGEAEGGPLVVVGAHYDSVEGSPGANDNASGVAVLIELARVLRGDTLPAIRWVAFANEEPPYFDDGDGMGSEAYVGGLGADRARVAGMLSLETLGYYRDQPGTQRYPPGVGWLFPDRGAFVAFVANPRSLALARRVVGAFRTEATIPSEGAALPASIPGVDWSDHRSFWRAGIPALMVTDTAIFRDPQYHRPGDTPDRLDYERMVRVVVGLAPAVRDLARTAP